jgi:hypothetical protein
VQTTTETWRYSLAARIVLGIIPVFAFGMAGFFFSMQFTVAAGDRLTGVFLDLLSLAVVGFAVFMTFGLIAAVRTRIAIDGTFFDATVIAGHSALLVPHFRTIRLPVAEIGSVERRVEISSILGLTAMRDSLSIVTTGGERIGLFSNTTGALNILPIDEIAAGIASAAGIAITDAGTVTTKSQGLYGAASSSWNETPLDAASAGKAKQVAVRTLQILVGLMTLGFVLRACF